MGWTVFYLLVASGIGLLVGAIGMLWYVSAHHHREDAVTMDYGRRYELTKVDAGHG